MTKHYLISHENWDKVLNRAIRKYHLYAPVIRENHQDYKLVEQEQDISHIIYNTAKPASPLKTFFLPVKENVVREPEGTSRIILGIPPCDLAGLEMLDTFYLEEPYVDPYYRDRRENTLLIGTDCFTAQEHCHCTTYGVSPAVEKYADIRLASHEGDMYLTVLSGKGEEFMREYMEEDAVEADESRMASVWEKSGQLKKELEERNSRLPGYERTGVLIRKSGEDIWGKYAADCVSCGACSSICPTCTCFLLIDRPEFEKVRSLDTCQHPAFERVAAGEDPLHSKSARFRNRYLCKYVWRPEKYNTLACTGCGRCIEACIARINKNELFVELNA